MRHRFKWFSRVAVASVAALVISACGGDDGGDASAAGGKGGGGGDDTETIRIGVGIDASFVPFYVADEEGFFADAGLDVEVVRYGFANEAVDALVAGQVDLAGVSGVTAVLQMQQSEDMRALAVYEESGEYVKVVTGEGIESAADIERVGIVPGLSELSMAKYLESEGIDPDSVEMIRTDPPEMPVVLGRGDIDAYVLWEPWPTIGAEGGGTVVATIGDYDWTFEHWLMSTASWVDANTEAAETLIRALADASEHLEAEPQATAEMVAELTEIPEEQTLTAIEQIDFAVRSFTEDDLAAAAESAEYFVQTGNMDEVPPFEERILLGFGD